LPGCNKPTAPGTAGSATTSEDEFLKLANTGRNYYEHAQPDKAIAAFQEALRLQPGNNDALLNLANALLLAGRAEEALKQAEASLALDRTTNAAAYYIAGCAALRLGRFEPAVKSLQAAKDIDRTVNEVSFQLGRAHQGLNQHEAAIAEFQEVARFGPTHPAAFYALSQSLLRVGQQEAAAQALEQHQKNNAGKPAQITDVGAFERCRYTAARVPFRQTPPDPTGIRIRFADATTAMLGNGASQLRGPVAVVDYAGARASLLLREGESSFRVLLNSNGVFSPAGNPLPAKSGARFRRALVADLNNDRAEDVLMLGDGGSHLFKITTNGTVSDATAFSNLRTLSATNGALADLLFTGNLGFIALGTPSENLRFYRNLGSMYFSTNATNSLFVGLPQGLTGVHQAVVEDWNGDDFLDLILQRDGQPPALLIKQPGGGFFPTNTPAGWPVASAIALGDLDNDFRADLVALSPAGITVHSGAGTASPVTIPVGTGNLTGLALVDYDADGWLDILATGDRLRVWRNRGPAGFTETTEALGLGASGAVEEVHAVDFDNDGDIDLLLTHPDQTLTLWRNEGGNANHLLKLRLYGNKSNSSGIGVRVEVATSGLRLTRRVSTLPAEIGVGPYAQIDSLNVRWFTLGVNTVDVKVEPAAVVRLDELTMTETSCPYLYAWDGTRFRFVSDILGAAPVGLPLFPGRYVDADADEFVWLGNESNFRPRDGRYRVSITEELKEVLYLDEARLYVVDHPEGTEVHPTDKLLPHGPFPAGELVVLENRHPLLKATRLDMTTDVTDLLQATDGRKVSPERLREYPLRGLAEPHGVVLDFGPLPASSPLVLALTGWLRFGGATANMAAAIHPNLPYPFPVLEAETAEGTWQRLDLEPGAPAGKTKTILIDLAGKLPDGARRLRLATAFEIHWDRIALFDRRLQADSRIIAVAPASSDLHWRGFGELAVLPWHEPQTPLYDRVQANPPWRTSPGGWATRYGQVDELIAARDNKLVLINSGDELVVDFDAAGVGVRGAGMARDFFLYSVGWDKDGDDYVARRDSFEPLPWHGMNDQRHGEELRPAFPDDGWMAKYNTRWCSPYVLTRSR
jgi:tetratricopeptide (TPR) repeat protein